MEPEQKQGDVDWMLLIVLALGASPIAVLICQRGQVVVEWLAAGAWWLVRPVLVVYAGLDV